ncbi:MAG: hypothetical protein ACREQR_20155 [Candidatus Binataceae bacterium]
MIVALGLRAVWLMRAGSAWTVATDSVGYLALAHGIREGCGFAAMNGSCGAAEVMRTPGYPLFLVPFLNHYRLAIFIQAIFGATVCILVAAYARRRYGLLAAVVAVAIVAFDPPSITVTKELLTEPLFQLILTGAVLAALSSRAIAAGFLFGAAALVRPVGIPLLLLAPAPFLISRHWLRAAVVFVVPVLMIGAWAVRNYRVAGVFTVTTEGAMTLYSFSVPDVISIATGVPLADAQIAAARALEVPAFGNREDLIARARQLSLYDEVSWAAQTSPPVVRFMLSRSIASIMSHPIATAWVTAVGLMRLAFEPHEPDVGLAKIMGGKGRAFQLLRFGSMALESILLWLIWIGVARAMWIYPRDGQLWILLGFALLLLLAAAPFSDMFDPRYRVPAIPFLATIAGVGWANLVALLTPGISNDARVTTQRPAMDARGLETVSRYSLEAGRAGLVAALAAVTHSGAQA